MSLMLLVNSLGQGVKSLENREVQKATSKFSVERLTLKLDISVRNYGIGL